MLAPYYKEGLELVYGDMRKIVRLVVPDPIPDAAIGSADVAQASR